MIADKVMAEIADYLLGTCKAEYEATQAFDLPDDASEEILSRINDYEIERCECCSRWVEIHELNEDNICEDCQDDR